MRAKPAGAGCYKAAYPSTTWVRIACGPPPPPKSAPQGAPNFGNADNIIQAQGVVSSSGGTLTTATGSIFDVFGLTNEIVTGNSPNANSANVYSLQINTNSGATPACQGSSNPGCNAFEQFVFDNNDTEGSAPAVSYVNITYVMNGYGASCPTSAAWQSDGKGNCYLATSETTLPDVQPLAALSGLVLTGGTTGGNDFATITLADGRAYTYQGTGSVLKLTNWYQVQFNVFGDKTVFNTPPPGANAQFNAGATMQVTTSIPARSGLSLTCPQNSFTAETANLGAASACTVTGGTSTIGIQFVQGTPPTNVAVSPSSGQAAGGNTITVTGTGFTTRMIANFNGTTVTPGCDTVTHCTVVTPPGAANTAVNVQMANVSPATGVVGVYSAAASANGFSYTPTPPPANGPQCGFSESCQTFSNNPPTYFLTCATPADFYSWTGTPISATMPPPGNMQLVKSNATSDSDTTTDYMVFIAACNPGTKSPCNSKSIYVPVANYCRGSGSGGSGGGGTVTCEQCRESGRACKVVNGKTMCVGNIQ